MFVTGRPALHTQQEVHRLGLHQPRDQCQTPVKQRLNPILVCIK